MFKSVIMLQKKHTEPFMLKDFVVTIHFRVELFNIHAMIFFNLPQKSTQLNGLQNVLIYFDVLSFVAVFTKTENLNKKTKDFLGIRFCVIRYPYNNLYLLLINQFL